MLVDYGDPITVPPDIVALYNEGGPSAREACTRLLRVIHTAIESVTITSTDIESTQFFWMMRRFYHEWKHQELHRRPTLEEKVALVRAFSQGFRAVSERQDTISLKRNVQQYISQLRLFGLRDWQVSKYASMQSQWIIHALAVSGRVLVSGLATLPAMVLGMPFILSYQLGRAWAKMERKKQLNSSSVKITGKDVVATYKVLISLLVSPGLHVMYVYLVWQQARHVPSPIAHRRHRIPRHVLWLFRTLQVSQRAAVTFFFFAPFISWFGLVRIGVHACTALGDLRTVLVAFFFARESNLLHCRRVAIVKDVVALAKELLGDDESQETSPNPAFSVESLNSAVCDTPMDDKKTA